MVVVRVFWSLYRILYISEAFFIHQITVEQLFMCISLSVRSNILIRSIYLFLSTDKSVHIRKPHKYISYVYNNNCSNCGEWLICNDYYYIVYNVSNNVIWSYNSDCLNENLYPSIINDKVRIIIIVYWYVINMPLCTHSIMLVAFFLILYLFCNNYSTFCVEVSNDILMQCNNYH